MKKRTKIIIGVAAVGVVAAGLLYSRFGHSKAGKYVEVTPEVQDLSSYLEFSGNLEAAETSTIFADASAKITEVKVEKGDHVKKGDVIAILDTSEVEYNIASQQAALSKAQTSDYYNIKDSQVSARQYSESVDSGYEQQTNSAQQTLLQAQTDYQTAVDTYNKAQADYDAGTYSSVVQARQKLDDAKYSMLNASDQHDQGMMSEAQLVTYQNSYLDAQENYDLAKKTAEKEIDDYRIAMEQKEEALAQAENSYNTNEMTVDHTVEKNDNAVEKAQATADQKGTQLQIDHLQESLSKYEVIAPIDGTITDLTAKEGAYATSGGSCGTITDFSVMQVAIKISEQDVANVKEGDPVTINVNSLGTTYDGKISEISKTAVVESNAVYVNAKVEFATTEEIATGLSADVQFVKQKADHALCLQSSNILYDTDNSAYVNVKGADGNPVKTPIKLGVTDGVYTEITEGLSENDIVLVTPTVTLPMNYATMGMEDMPSDMGDQRDDHNDQRGAGGQGGSGDAGVSPAGN